MICSKCRTKNIGTIVARGGHKIKLFKWPCQTCRTS